jgi:hypothetical protein
MHQVLSEPAHCFFLSYPIACDAWVTWRCEKNRAP